MKMENKQSMLRDGALEGQVIVITGGGTGLGRSMAEAFVRLGPRCALPAENWMCCKSQLQRS